MKKEEMFSPDVKEIIGDSVTVEGTIFYLDLDILSELSPETAELLETQAMEFMEELKIILFERFGFCEEVRLKNSFNKKEIKAIRSKDIDRVVSISGVIRRVTKVMPRTTKIKFECPSCGTIVTVMQESRTIKYPTRCSCGRTSNFKEVSRDVIDIQELNLESLPEKSNGQPQQIRVLLERGLVDMTLNDSLRPGKRIEVIGILKEMPNYMSNKPEDSILSEFMVHGNNIISLEESSEVSVSDEDIVKIRELLKENPLEFLARNLAPEIHGNNEIKKALILQMVKGVNKEKSDGSHSRGDIHIMLAGDPGVAKSVLSKFAEKKSPGSKTIIGTRTSKASLGAMAVKDELTGTWALEIGPLVQCNNSVLYFDEIDKMAKDNVNELLEPMASSCVTVNKAGISATLPSATSICASANPKKGNYDLSQPLARQIDIPSPVLNRFDLVFVMVDRPDSATDSESISHVFNSYLEKRESEISTAMFRKIVSYCRKFKPKLKPEILDYLRPLYVNLRKLAERESTNAIPINLRNIEALIRLSEAHAKLRMSEFVEKEDFEVAKSIFMYCLKQVGIENELGMVDMSRMTEKIPTSHRGRINTVLEVLHNMAKKEDTTILKAEEIYVECDKLGIGHYETTTFLNELKQKGEVIEKTRGVWKLL